MDKNKGTIKMITVTTVVSKPDNVESFYIPSAEFKSYRKTNFIDTNKISSHNWSTTGNQRTTIITFENESLMNEYYNDTTVLENSNLSAQYNATNNITYNKVIS